MKKNWNFEDFRYTRIFTSFNRLIQFFLAICLIFGLNYLASLPTFYKRWNINPENQYSISNETRMYLETALKNIPEEEIKSDQPLVRVILTLPKTHAGMPKEESAILDLLRLRISGLLDEFKYELIQMRLNNLVTFETADLYKNTKLTSELYEKNIKVTPDTALVVLTKDRGKTISTQELIQVKRDAAGNAIDIDGFRGEEAILSAILDVANTQSPVVYVLSGHGEAQIDSSSPIFGLSAFAQQLRSRRIIVKSLNLSESTELPSDASMLLIANPQGIIPSFTEEKIARYLRDRNGRVLLLVAPGRPLGLQDLLFDWGIRVHDSLLVETRTSNLLADGNISLNLFSEKAHKIAEILIQARLPLIASKFRPVEEDIGAKEDHTRKISTFVFSSNSAISGTRIPTSWGEQDYQKPPYRYDENRGDIPGPVSVAAVSERVAGSRLGINIPGGRLIVVGAGDLASNVLLEQGGNKTFLLNAVNWLTNRETLLNIPPRPISEFQLKAGIYDLKRVAWHFLIFPSIVALFGIFIFFWRRHI